MHLMLLLDPADVTPSRVCAAARAGRPDSDMLRSDQGVAIADVD